MNSHSNLIRAENPGLLWSVKSDLTRGNIVIATGGTRTGKSWLVDQIFEENAVVDKKQFALNGDVERVRITAVERWLARTANHIAIDEAQLFTPNEIIFIVKTSLSVNKGILIATQQESNIPHALRLLAKKNDVALKHYRFIRWDHGRKQPEWEARDDTD